MWLGRIGIMHIAGGYGRRRIVTFFDPFAVRLWVLWSVVDLAHLFIFRGVKRRGMVSQSPKGRFISLEIPIR